MISAPPSGKTALQFGAIFAVSLSACLIALILTSLSKFIPGLIFSFGLPALTFFLAGLFAARRTGRLSTGTLAGLWSSIISTLISIAAWFIEILTSKNAAFIASPTGSPINSHPAPQIIWIAFVFLALVFLCVEIGIGSGFGTLGGLIGKRRSSLARQSDIPYPPASLPLQTYQEFAYQAPPPPQHVYHLRPMWRVFYAGIFPLMNVIVGLSLITQYQGAFGGSAFSLFMICFVVLAVGYNTYYGIRMSMARLVTSPTGVMYYGVGFRIYAPWHQITGIDKVRKRWMRITGLTFRTPVVQTLSANQTLQEQVPVLEISGWRRPFYRQYTKLIPLTWFVGNLQTSALGGDIRWSAPQLLGGIPSAS